MLTTGNVSAATSRMQITWAQTGHCRRMMNECSRGPLSSAAISLSTDDVHSSSAQTQLTASAENGPFIAFQRWISSMHSYAWP